MNRPMTVTEMARMGGKARMAGLSRKEKSDLARRAARARWTRGRTERFFHDGTWAQKARSPLERVDLDNGGREMTLAVLGKAAVQAAMRKRVLSAVRSPLRRGTFSSG